MPSATAWWTQSIDPNAPPPGLVAVEFLPRLRDVQELPVPHYRDRPMADTRFIRNPPEPLGGQSSTEQAMKPIRIIMADDHPSWLEAVRDWLSASGEFRIEGCATNGQDAVALCRQVRPDVAVLDISMPGMNGIEATREILGDSTAAHVILVSCHDLDEYHAAAQAAGAVALVAKHLLREQLETTMKRLFNEGDVR